MKPRHPSRAHASHSPAPQSEDFDHAAEGQAPQASESHPPRESRGPRSERFGDEFRARRPRAPRDHAPRQPREPEVMPEIPAAFAELGLAEPLLFAVGALGYTEPTPVQLQSIGHAIGAAGEDGQSVGADLMVSSQTGSGKTAAFLLPVLHTILAGRADGSPLERMPHPMRRGRFQPARPQALVLCPTRELAQQVSRDAIDLLRFARGVRVAVVTGGSSYTAQLAQLQNATVVVATPGRLLDLESSGSLQLDEVRFLVVDEADRMLDLGFADDLEAINQLTANREQTMMFSATFAPPIQKLGLRVMREGGAHTQKVEIHSAQESHANIEQQLYWADNPMHKRELLDHWLRSPEIEQAIVFASTQIECDELAIELQDAGFNAAALHGAMNQGLRNRRLKALRQAQIQILVATDVAARGIDVPTITHVFNFGLPMKAEDYTHRIGRTGRAGRQGRAVTFAEWRDMRKVRDIQYFTQQDIAEATVPGLEPRNKPAPKRKAPAGGKRGGFGGAKGGARGFGGSKFGGDRLGERRFDDRPAGGDRGDFRGERGPRDGERRDGGFRGDRAREGFGQRDFGQRDFGRSDRARDERPRGDSRFANRDHGGARHDDRGQGFGHKPRSFGNKAGARRFSD